MAVCREVMTPDPACCQATDSIVRVAQFMKTEDVGAVPGGDLRLHIEQLRFHTAKVFVHSAAQTFGKDGQVLALRKIPGGIALGFCEL